MVRRGALSDRVCRPLTSLTALRSGAVSVYARHLLALQENMVSRGYKNAKEWPVIVTTDESDPACVRQTLAIHSSLQAHS